MQPVLTRGYMLHAPWSHFTCISCILVVRTQSCSAQFNAQRSSMDSGLFKSRYSITTHWRLQGGCFRYTLTPAVYASLPGYLTQSTNLGKSQVVTCPHLFINPLEARPHRYFTRRRLFRSWAGSKSRSGGNMATITYPQTRTPRHKFTDKSKQRVREQGLKRRITRT